MLTGIVCGSHSKEGVSRRENQMISVEGKVRKNSEEDERNINVLFTEAEMSAMKK